MTIHDPKLYRELCEPFENYAEAEKGLAAFHEGLRELRKTYGIPDIQCVVAINAIGDNGEEGRLMITLSAGDSNQKEAMLAWAFGEAQAERQQAISQTFESTRSVKKRGNK